MKDCFLHAPRRASHKLFDCIIPNQVLTKPCILGRQEISKLTLETDFKIDFTPFSSDSDIRNLRQVTRIPLLTLYVMRLARDHVLVVGNAVILCNRCRHSSGSNLKIVLSSNLTFLS